MAVRIFISSPADVRPERLKAEQIVARLGSEFEHHFHLESILWEREPLVATAHPQDPQNIPRPSASDIVVVILWSKLGLPLPADTFSGAVSGRRPVTGTEWEFEDALAGARKTGTPHLLCYRKLARITADLDDEAGLRTQQEQRQQVRDFFARWFEGPEQQSLTAAAHSFHNVDEFEDQLYRHLRALLKRRVDDTAGRRDIRWHSAPFRALLSYEYQHAPVFFGRTRARNALRELLAQQITRGIAFVLVLGASGAGKSSLVKAGLLPDLALPGMIGRVALTRRAVMRPSDANGNPISALAASILSATALPELTDMGYSPQRLCSLLEALPDGMQVPVEQGLSAAGKTAGLTSMGAARLIVVIDQLEEIFTLDGLTAEARSLFVAALASLARSGLVWVVATMRSDSFDRLVAMPALVALSDGARYVLAQPDAAEIGQIICQPASEAGLTFETDLRSGERLDDVIRKAAEGYGALPLLSFLLDQLWQKRSENGALTFAAYAELGGLEGAIGNCAEEILQRQPEVFQEEFPGLLRRLVTVHDGVATARTVPLSLFPEGTGRRALVEAFLDPGARLLVADGEPGRAQIRLAHEALLTHWRRARDQIAADKRDLVLCARLEDEAAEWQAAPKRARESRTRSGLPLAEALALLVRWGNELPLEVLAFIAASRRAARQRRFRSWSLLLAGPVAVISIVGIAWVVQIWLAVRAVEAEMKFVELPAGCFAMGSPETEAGRFQNEGPQHKVCVKNFDLGQYEVTQDEWRQVMRFIDPDPSIGNSSSPGRDPRLPVDSVSWNGARRFALLMSMFGHRSYRLPNEAEWEYAARADTASPYYWGDDIAQGCAYENIPDISLKGYIADAITANCDDGNHGAARVGSYKPNPWRLYDMLGNLSEMVADCYSENFKDTPTDGSRNTKGDCDGHVIRGGSWNNPPRDIRAAYRRSRGFGKRSYSTGFRIARDAER